MDRFAAWAQVVSVVIVGVAAGTFVATQIGQVRVQKNLDAREFTLVKHRFELAMGRIILAVAQPSVLADPNHGARLCGSQRTVCAAGSTGYSGVHEACRNPTRDCAGGGSDDARMRRGGRWRKRRKRWCFRRATASPPAIGDCLHHSRSHRSKAPAIARVAGVAAE
jgi:hypothetical protein